MRPAIRNVRPSPRSTSTGSERASGSLSSSSSGRPNDTSKPIGVDVESADSASRNSSTSARKSLDSRSRISVVAAGISSFSCFKALLSTCHQPRAVVLVRTTVGVARAAQQRGVQLVQLRAARQRIQPDVLVALAFVQRAARPTRVSGRSGTDTPRPSPAP